MDEHEQVYVWISRWDEFQTYTIKRGKPWAPPWIKMYPRLLDDPEFRRLTEANQLLLVKLWMLFARAHGKVVVGTRSVHQAVTKDPRSSHEGITWDSRSLAKQLAQRVTKQQLVSLNRAGFIQFCSGTVRERFWNAFLNGSVLEVEVEVDNPNPTPPVARGPAHANEPNRKNGLGGEESKNGTTPVDEHADSWA